MSKYDANPLIEGRYDAYGRQTYWEQGYYGQGVKVAVIDEFDAKHGPYMASKREYLAPKSELLKIDVEVAAVHEIIRGLKECIAEGVNIVSISMSTDRNRSDLHDIVKECRDLHNMLIFCSAGNNGREYRDYIDIKRWPAAYPETISCLSVDNDFTFSDFASHNSAATITGFGYNSLAKDEYGNEALIHGTSPVTPDCAFTAALHWCKYLEQYGQDPTVDYMTDFVINHTVDLGKASKDNFFGYGFFTLDIKEFDRVKLMLLDTDGNGTIDALDEMRKDIKIGMSYEDAWAKLERNYYIIGHRIENGSPIPMIGGRKVLY